MFDEYGSDVHGSIALVLRASIHVRDWMRLLSIRVAVTAHFENGIFENCSTAVLGGASLVVDGIRRSGQQLLDTAEKEVEISQSVPCLKQRKVDSNLCYVPRRPQ